VADLASPDVAGLADALASDAYGADDWRDALGDLMTQAQHTHPSVTTPSTQHLADCLRGAGATAPTDLPTIDAGEIWLSAACADGNPEALAIFERDYMARLAPALHSMDLAAAEIDEVQQRVRERLLTAQPERSIVLFQYAGRGRLFGLVKVVAIRIALDDIRRRQRAPDRVSAREQTVARLMDGGLGPELALVETQHREAVKDAFASAVESLPADQRAILRMHLLDRASIDEIAALHSVHRATAARWLTRIRGQLASGTHEALRTALALDESRLSSLMRAVDSRLDLSLSRLLSPPSGDSDPSAP